MKIFNLGLLLLITITVTVTVTTALSLRRTRDIAEAYNYLPPNSEQFALPSESESETTDAPIPTTEIVTDKPTTIAPSSSNGYEYRTVRRLKYRLRTQRDVSHLFAGQHEHQQYLPPTNEYLPPQQSNSNGAEVAERPVGEYLPPVNTEAPSTETPELTPDLNSESESEPELEGQEILSTESPQDNSALNVDGYHYKEPEVPFGIQPQPASGEYLPPLEKGVVEADGPEEGESSILADDGYHYRIIKRFRL